VLSHYEIDKLIKHVDELHECYHHDNVLSVGYSSHPNTET